MTCNQYGKHLPVFLINLSDARHSFTTALDVYLTVTDFDRLTSTDTVGHDNQIAEYDESYFGTVLGSATIKLTQTLPNNFA